MRWERKDQKVSALSDNENNEIKIQQSNDRRARISKYLKDEKDYLKDSQSDQRRVIFKTKTYWGDGYHR